MKQARLRLAKYEHTHRHSRTGTLALLIVRRPVGRSKSEGLHFSVMFLLRLHISGFVPESLVSPHPLLNAVGVVPGGVRLEPGHPVLQHQT